MLVRERILAARLSEKIEKNPEYAKELGITLETAGCGFTAVTEGSSLPLYRRGTGQQSGNHQE